MIRLEALCTVQHGQLPFIGPAQFKAVLHPGLVKFVRNGFQPGIVPVKVRIFRTKIGIFTIDTDKKMDMRPGLFHFRGNDHSLQGEVLLMGCINNDKNFSAASHVFLLFSF